jgi:FkbM family methyltransferase
MVLAVGSSLTPLHRARNGIMDGIVTGHISVGDHTISQTAEGVWVIDDDTHFKVWIEQAKKLDHDPWLLPQIVNFIQPGGTVVDCGAYIGDHTIAYKRRAGPEGRVLAFEPNPAAHACLVRNCPDVEAHMMGLGATDSTANLTIAPGNYGASRINETGGMPIEIRALDSFGLDRLDVMKVDAEGFELKVLEGARETIARCRPVLALEVQQACLANNGVGFGDMIAALTEMNYIWLRTDATAEGSAPQFDIMALPMEFSPISFDNGNIVEFYWKRCLGI